MRNILEILFKRRIAIIRIVVLLMILIVAGIYLRTPQYLSETRILIPVGREINAAPITAAAALQSMFVHVNRSEQIQTQIEVLLSRRLIEDTVDRMPEDLLRAAPVDTFLGKMRYYAAEAVKLPFYAVLRVVGLMPNTTDRERLIVDCVKRLSVKKQNDSEVLIVSFRHSSPKFAQAFLTHFLQSYEALRSQGSAVSSTPFYASQQTALREELNAASQKLASFREEWGLLDVAIQKEQFVTEYTRLEGVINRTKATLVQVEIAILSLEGEAGMKNPEIYLTETMRADQGVLENLRSLAALQARESRLGAEIGPDHPEIVILRREINILREIIYNEALTSLKNQYKTNQTLLAELERQRKEISDRMMTIDSKALEMRNLQAEVDFLADAVIEYSSKREVSRVSAAMDAEQINTLQVVEPPTRPYTPVAPRPLRDIVFGLVFSVLVALGYAYLRENFSGTVNNLESLAQIFPDKMVVSLPDLEGEAEFKKVFDFKAMQKELSLRSDSSGLVSAADGSLEIVGDGHNRILGLKDVPEASLTMLIRKFFYRGQKLHIPRTLLVVGSNSGTGTSTVARVLAQYLAFNFNTKVLLVDAKLAETPAGRRETQLLPEVMNLSEWLLAKQPLSGQAGQVDFMPSGPGGPKAISELLKLGSQDLNRFGDYDLVIFDAAPPTGDSVSFHLASLVEGAIVVARVEHTRKAVLAEVKADLDLSGANVLGAVCNRRHFYIPQWIYGRL